MKSINPLNLFKVRDLVCQNLKLLFVEKINIEIVNNNWYLNGDDYGPIYHFWLFDLDTLKSDFVDGLFFKDEISTLAFFYANYYEFIKKDKLIDKFNRVTFFDSFFYDIGLVHTEAYVDSILRIISKRHKFSFRNPRKLIITHDIDLLGLPRNRDFLRFVYYMIRQFKLVQLLQVIIYKLFWFNPFNIHYLYFFHKLTGTIGDFFFLTQKQPTVSGGYDIKDLNQIKSIIQKYPQHGVGIHYNDDYLSKGVKTKPLEEILNVKIQTGRAHYLIYNVETTLSILSEAYITIDSTLGFNDMIGYRQGTSHAFYPWDWSNDKVSNVLEVPLIVMDGTLRFSMKLGLRRAYKRLKDMIDEIEINHGNFTILWHNSSVIGDGWLSWTILYIMIIIYSKKKGFKSSKLEDLIPTLNK